METFRHFLAILLLPVMAAVVAPAAILYLTGTEDVGWPWPEPWSLVTALAGSLLVCFGLALMARAIHLFVTVGEGTLAPWDPTQKLVVHGIYRHVRNPMISGVFFILLGESIVSGSLWLLGWFGCFVLANVVYIPLLEEPGLVRRFGDDYREYAANVPRWLPRLKPWESASAGNADA